MEAWSDRSKGDCLMCGEGREVFEKSFPKFFKNQTLLF